MAGNRVATIATFHRPRYEVNGEPSDGEEAVRELLQGLTRGSPDLHVETARLRHLDDGVPVEGIITGTHEGELAGIPPSGNSVIVPVVGIFEFDGDRLLCEKVFLDMATVLTQMGALPAVS
jgi:predicted ester cyclase